MKTIFKLTVTLGATLFLLGAAQADSKEADASSSGNQSTTVNKVQKGVEKGGKAAVGGIERGAKATGNFVERGAKAAGRGIEKGVNATEKAVGITHKSGQPAASSPPSPP